MDFGESSAMTGFAEIASTHFLPPIDTNSNLSAFAII